MNKKQTMPGFQKVKSQTEKDVMVRLLTSIDEKSEFTQRGLAKELGIALGLMNQYLKRCVMKGWVRGMQITPKRMLYFITPDGIAEKGKMMKDYLNRSLSFFKEAKTQCEAAFKLCTEFENPNIALFGSGDLADIAMLVGSSQKLNITCIDDIKNIQHYDICILTDTQNPQQTYFNLCSHLTESRIIILPLLKISRRRESL